MATSHCPARILSYETMSVARGHFSGAFFDPDEYFAIDEATGAITIRWALPNFEAHTKYSLDVIVVDQAYESD